MKNMLKIRELRLAEDLKQAELAEKLGVKSYTVSNWEQGRCEPSADDLLALANFFGCTVDYLFGREDDFGNVNVSERSSEDLSENERRLLEQFRLMPEARQRTVLDMVEGLAESSVAAGGKKRA